VKFGPVALVDALGAVMAHSVKLPDGTLKKGVVLTAADLQRLATAGLRTVVTARLDSDDVPEDVAAERVATALAGVAVEIGSAVTGRVNLYARGAGLLLLDAARIHAANLVHEGLTIATLHPDTPVGDGQMLATVKIIPYAVPAAALLEVVRVLGGAAAAMRVAPWQAIRVGLVLTQTADTAASVLAKMRHAVVDRLLPLGATLVAEEIVAHDEAAVAAALEGLAQSSAAPGLLLVSGIAATVDRNDVVPAAVIRAGGSVKHAGMPVDPGNLLVLAQLGNELPVVGIPTCARSPKLNGFDFVLRRFAAGEPVSATDIQAMGVGGLLTEMENRPMPRDSRRRG
jgi:molybdenum cofactor cytidylyltransferase